MSQRTVSNILRITLKQILKDLHKRYTTLERFHVAVFKLSPIYLSNMNVRNLNIRILYLKIYI